jgi:signal transduction histidine kinase
MDSTEVLSDAILILATSPDFDAAMDNLSRLATSSICDRCLIFTFENNNNVRRLLPLEGLYPLDLHASYGPGYVLRTGEPQCLVEMNDEVLASFGLPADDPAFEDYRRHSSCLCMPIVARERTIGAIAFLSVRPGADLGERHLPIAQALANAAAVALDQADLYRKAQEASRLKDEFVAMVSHELRTPLTPILGCIHLLRTTQLSQSNFERALGLIERNAQTQVQIVEDLLDASRIVAGKLHLVMKSVQLIPVLEAALASVRVAAEGKGITIAASFENVADPIDGDSHRLQQIVWHLLSNAVKFTSSAGRVDVSLKSEGGHAVIQVSDTGIGIPPNLLPHIFDRSRPTTDDDSKLRSGLGLGLSIVRHLVELHHGSIEAASAGRNRGAIFTVKFPFAARRAMAVGNSAEN